MRFPFTFSFKSTPPGRVFGILWVSLARYQCGSQPSFEASHNAHRLQWKTRLLSSWVSSVERVAIGASFEEII